MTGPTRLRRWLLLPLLGAFALTLSAQETVFGSVEDNYQRARTLYLDYAADSSLLYLRENWPRLADTGLVAADHHYLRGKVYTDLADYPAAAADFERSLQLFGELPEGTPEKRASILLALGTAYLEVLSVNRGVALLEEGLALRREVFGTDSPKLVPFLNNLANGLDDKGEIDRAIAYYRQALDVLAGSARNPEYLATVYGNLAAALVKHGAYEEAEGYRGQAERLLSDSTNARALNVVGGLYQSRANTYANLGDLAASNAASERALEIYAAVYDSLDAAVVAVRNNQAINRTEAGDYAGAIAILEPLVVATNGVAGSEVQHANLRNDLGAAYFGAGRLADARREQEAALAIQTAALGTDALPRAYTLNQLARIALATGDTATALDRLAEALPANGVTDADPTGYRNFTFYLETLHLRAAAQHGTDAAMATYATADAALSQRRNALITAADKIAFARAVAENSRLAVAEAYRRQLAGEKGFVTAAFHFAERSKANVLSHLLTLNQGKQYAGIPEDSLRLEQQLQTDLNFYRLKLTEDQPDPARREQLAADLFAAREAYRRLVEDFERRYPAYHALKYQDAPPNPEEVRQSLPAGVAVISYLTTPEHLYVFLIDREGYRLTRQPLAADFARRCDALKKVIVRRLDEDYRQLARELYTELFPFELAPEITQLVIVPDGNLSRVPFATLLRGPADGEDFTQLPYLLRDYAISYAPSVRLYLSQLRRPARDYDNDLLAYAPVFADPTQLSELRRVGNDIGRTVSVDGQTVAALPGSLREVERIAELFTARDLTAQTYFYDRATERGMKANLDRSHRYVHVATHGFVNPEEPSRSGLIFYPDNADEEDHLLLAGELYSLRLDTDLAILSACETGLGRTVNGEGVIGLARAFLYAGASNLLVSLWKVQDEATAELMLAFYRDQLTAAERRGYGTSLRTAKLQLIATDRFAHPYYWSSFVLIGN